MIRIRRGIRMCWAYHRSLVSGRRIRRRGTA